MGGSKSKEDDGKRSPKRLKTTFISTATLQYDDIDVFGKTPLHEEYDEIEDVKSICENFDSRAKHRKIGCYRGFKKAEISSENKEADNLQIMGIMDHPNILKIHEMYSRDGEKVAAFEYPIGPQLSDYPMAGNPFNEEDCAYIIYQLLRALNYMHLNGYMHRNVQPKNINFDTNDRDKILKLANFKNVGKIIKKGLPKVQSGKATPYQAPEMNQSSYDEKVDIFACGMIMLQMLNGEIAPNLVEDIEKSKSIMLERYMSIPITIEARDLILSMIKKNPKQRPPAHKLLNNKWFKNQLKQKEPMFESCLNYSLNRLLKLEVTSRIALLGWIAMVKLHLNVDDISKVSRGFIAADVAHSGVLSSEQLKDLMKPWLENDDDDDDNDDGGDEENKKKQKNIVEKAIEKYQEIFSYKSHDGLTYTSFLAMCIERADFTAIEYVDAAFRTLDVDKNGKISSSDITDLKKSNRILGLKSEFWNEIINEVYKLPEGLTYEEFLVEMKEFLKRPSERIPKKK